jgi:hypothetical protein
MASILADLMLRLRANSAELQKNLDIADKALKDTGKATTELGKTMKDTMSKAAGAIDNVIPGFSSLTSGIGKAITTVTGLAKSMNVLKIALISTGIGALVVALGSLISYFKNTEKGADAFAKVMNGIKSVITTVIKRINLLGEAVVKLLKGDFKGAAEAARAAFSDLGDEIKSAYKAGQDIEERRDALEDSRIGFMIREKELVNQIAESKAIIADSEASTVEKQKALTDEIAAQNELTAKNKAFAVEEYAIAVEQNKLKEKTADTIREENELYGKIIDIDTQHQEALKGIYKEEKRVNSEIKKEADERKAVLDRVNEIKFALSGLQPVIVPIIPKIVGKAEMPGLQNPITIPPPDLSRAEAAWQDYSTGTASVFELIKRQGMDAFNTLATGAINVGEIISGGLVAAVNSLTNAFSNLFSGSAAGFKDVLTVALNTISQIINALFAEAIAATIAKNAKFPFGLALAAIGIAALTALWKSKVPEFATGGLAYGPTMGIVGEYPNARSNPEVIAPLSDLRNIIGDAGFGGEVKFVIEQEQLVGILSNYNKKNIYF